MRIALSWFGATALFTCQVEMTALPFCCDKVNVVALPNLFNIFSPALYIYHSEKLLVLTAS